MTHEPPSEHVAAPAEAEWILATLEADQLVAAKSAPVPRRRLSQIELLVLWALRLYVVFMMAVVFWQAWTATR